MSKRPTSLKGWPALIRNGAHAEFSSEDREIIGDIQKQINELSKCTDPSSEEEMSPEVPEIRCRPFSSFDLEDDPFLACEQSESD